MIISSQSNDEDDVTHPERQVVMAVCSAVLPVLSASSTPHPKR